MRIASYVKKVEVVVSFAKGKESAEFIQEIFVSLTNLGFSPLRSETKKSVQFTFEATDNNELESAKYVIKLAQIQQKQGYKK